MTWVACVRPTPEVEPTVAPPPAFSESGAVEMPERWWSAFGDPVLDSLVERALSSNLDLASTWYRLREAEAVAERAGADLLPSLDADATGRVRRADAGGLGDFTEPGDDPTDDPDDPDVPDDGDVSSETRQEELRLGLTATYEVDLWGRIRSRADAERLRFEATRLEVRTAALSLSAEVVRTYFQVVEARDQIALLDSQIEANETVGRLLENRFGSGQVRAVDVLRQRQLVESTREERLGVQSRLRVLEHLLAVLVGRPPKDDVGVAATLPALPPLPATGVPAELLRRRPDVARAHRLLEAADRDLAAAVAARYPRLSLTASVTTSNEGAEELFEDFTRTLVGNLLAPVFRGGDLEAEVDRSEAVRAQRLYRWGQTTLDALREVEDALARERFQEERVASLERQVRWTEQSYDQLRIEYFNGLGDYVDVLLAQTEKQRLRRDLVSARRELLERRVVLYRALAGGFDVAGPLVATEPGSPPPSAMSSEPQSSEPESQNREDPS